MRIPTAVKGAVLTTAFVGGMAAGPVMAAAPASAAPVAAAVSTSPTYFYHATSNGAADPNYFYHA